MGGKMPAAGDRITAGGRDYWVVYATSVEDYERIGKPGADWTAASLKRAADLGTVGLSKGKRLRVGEVPRLGRVVADGSVRVAPAEGV